MIASVDIMIALIKYSPFGFTDKYHPAAHNERMFKTRLPSSAMFLWAT
jgi:hypothetical protein